MKTLQRDTHLKIMRISFLIALAIVVLLILSILFTRTANQNTNHSDTYTSIDKELSLTPGGSDFVDITNLKQYYHDDSDTLSLYWQIPASSNDNSFIFRSKDVYCYAYIEGKEVFATQPYESKFYIASPGNNWNVFTVPSNSNSQILELQIKYVYGTDAITADHFYWGNRSDWVTDLIISKSMAIFLSVFIVFVGVIVLSMDRSSFKQSGKHSLLYLGIYAILMGLWSLIETNTLQAFINDGRLLQLIDNLLMITDTLPLFFYLDLEFEIYKHRTLWILSILDIIYIYTCIIGQFTGLVDIHNLLQGSWIATGLSFVILVFILIKQIRDFRNGKEIKPRKILQMIGFISLMIIVVICLPIYINSDGMDRAASIRLGMLVMIIMFSIAGQLQTYELIKQGTRYNIVKNLAYQDALTGLCNRTSFLEALDNYSENPPENLGIAFFDVNNLKLANDNYGHETGDQLLCLAANIIQDSFIGLGTAYRTGGDEFIVIFDNDNPEINYKKGISEFYKKEADLNAAGEFVFSVEIAHGFATRIGTDKESLKAMIELADSRMYENKRLIKETASK